MPKPQGVRIHHLDTDTWTEVELEFAGFTEAGGEMWRIANAVLRADVDDLHVDVWPGNTSIGPLGQL
jgi:hypothetical protein